MSDEQKPTEQQLAEQKPAYSPIPFDENRQLSDRHRRSLVGFLNWFFSGEHLLAKIAGFLVVVLGVAATILSILPEENRNEVLYAMQVVARPTATMTPTSTPIPTNTLLPTATPTPTTTPTITPTPLEGRPFAEGEVGVILAQIDGDPATAETIRVGLRDALREANIPFIEVSHTIPAEDYDRAQMISDIYNGTLVVWGRPLSLFGEGFGIEMFYKTTPRGDRNVEVEVDRVLAQVAELDNFNTFVLSGQDLSYVANFVVGQILYFDEAYDLAIDRFTRAIHVIEAETSDRINDLKAESLYLFLGNTHYMIADYAIAIENYDQAIALNSNFVDAYNNRGIAAKGLGWRDEAIQDYDQAIALNSEYATAYYNRGIVYYELGQYERAIQDYDRALDLDLEEPFKNAYAYTNRGNAYYEMGSYEHAIHNHDQALDLYPDFVIAFNNRGNVYRALGNYKRAIEDFDQALNYDPEFGSGYSNRGVVYTYLGNYEEAKADFDHAIEINNEDVFAYYNRGNLYLILGDYEQEKTDYDRAIEIDPRSANAYYNRGNLYIYLEDFEQAKADYDSAIDLGIGAAEVYWGRGSAHYMLGNYEASIKDYLHYEQLTGVLTPLMVDLIAEMEAALTATPAP